MNTATALVRFAGSTPQAATDEITVGRVRVFNTRAGIAYRRDEQEWRRRGGPSSILGLDVLDALMNLPAGLPVPASSVTRADRRLLNTLPAGALEWSDTTVTRRVVPALTPMLAMVRATGWLDGVKAASRFAAYCRRLVIVSTLPDDTDAALAQASLYGIGVAVMTSSVGPRIVVEPEPLPDWQPTPAWWWFSEEIYRQVHSDD